MHDEKKIVSLINNGDMAAFRLLVKQYERLVLFMVSKLIKDKEDAEDICQEVFILVYKNLASFKFDSKLSTWIAQIAYRTAVNYLKKNKKHNENREDLHSIENVNEPGQSPEQVLTNKEQRIYIHDLIEKLPDHYKIVLTLYHLQEFSYQEIAEITKMPEGTVKNYLFRARRMLKEELEVYLKGEMV